MRVAAVSGLAQRASSKWSRSRRSIDAKFEQAASGDRSRQRVRCRAVSFSEGSDASGSDDTKYSCANIHSESSLFAFQGFSMALGQTSCLVSNRSTRVPVFVKLFRSWQ